MSGHYFLLYYSESWQRKRVTQGAVSSYVACLYLGLLCWWTHSCFCCRNESRLSFSLSDRESKRERGRVQKGLVNCTVPVVSQLKLVKQESEDFSGVSTIDPQWSRVQELKARSACWFNTESDQSGDSCSEDRKKTEKRKCSFILPIRIFWEIYFTYLQVWPTSQAPNRGIKTSFTHLKIHRSDWQHWVSMLSWLSAVRVHPCLCLRVSELCTVLSLLSPMGSGFRYLSTLRLRCLSFWLAPSLTLLSVSSHLCAACGS